MELLTFSNIITLIKEYYCYSITSEELTKNIISELVNEDYKIKLNSSILNKYYNGERDLPSLIKENLEKKKYKNNFINYIKDVIYKELVSVLIDDFFYKLKNIINNDDTITPKTKNKLLYYENDYPEFLSTSFVYAIKKNNKKPFTYSSFSYDDLILYNETDQQCPLCRKLLFKKLKKDTLFYFTSVNIFPFNLPPELENEFISIHKKPSNLDHIDNKICLCDECAKSYISNPTLEIFDKLSYIKEKLIKKSKIRDSSLELDNKIIEILENLKTIDYDDEIFKNLRLKPLPVNKKINDNFLLENSINNDNQLYYFFIKDKLSELDNYKKPFKLIATQIRLTYLKISDNYDDQEILFNDLVQWILSSQSLKDNYKTAARIIISFFVQNCEVFDEITK